MNDRNYTLQFVAIVSLAFFCLGGSLGLLALRRQPEIQRECIPHAYWLADAAMHRGNRYAAACDNGYTIAAQTAMDGYMIVCNCSGRP